MICGRCLKTESGRSADVCLSCEWEHRSGCDQKSCAARGCGPALWPDRPEPHPQAAGPRLAAYQQAKAAELAAREKHKADLLAEAQASASKARRDAEREALLAELAAVDPPPPPPTPKTPAERAAEIRARLAELEGT